MRCSCALKPRAKWRRRSKSRAALRHFHRRRGGRRLARRRRDQPEDQEGGDRPARASDLVENPDILAGVARGSTGDRPPLVVGFAAETENLVEHAREKLARKGCDLIVANDVSAAAGVMGGDENTMVIVTPDGETAWPKLDKDAAAAGSSIIWRQQFCAATGTLRWKSGSRRLPHARRPAACRPIRALARPASISSPPFQPTHRYSLPSGRSRPDPDRAGYGNSGGLRSAGRGRVRASP